MKDITHYFATPSKGTEKSATKKLIRPSEHLNPRAEVKITSTIDTAINVDLNPTVENPDGNASSKKKKSKGHKRKKRKLSDPMVSSVAQLLDSSLIIVSPNTSGSTKNNVSDKGGPLQVKDGSKRVTVGLKVVVEDNKQPSKVNGRNSLNNAPKNSKDEENTKESEVNKTYANQESTNNKNKENASLKPNAFQFLMDSRHKVIGANSSGNEKGYQSSFSEENKEKLALRKSVLQNWSEKRGASKRMREDEERGLVIQDKLNKRAKRLKNMLSLSNDVEHSAVDLHKVKKRKRRIVKQIISSDSDSNPDPVIQMDLKEKVKNPESVFPIDEDAQDCIVVSTPKFKGNNKGTLLNFFGMVHQSDGKGKVESKIKGTTKDSNSNHKSRTKSNKKLDNDSVRRSSRHLKVFDESSQDSDLSSTKITRNNWKMKIKILNTSHSDASDFEDSNTFSEKKSKPRQEAIKCKRQKKKTHQEDNNSKEKILISSASSSSISSESEEDNLLAKKEAMQQKVRKVAPVFVKAAPKPKIEPAIIEARKQFLMSGIPSSLKKAVEKQQSIEQREYDVFPKISHVQQKTESEPQFWNLPSQILNLKKNSSIKLPEMVINCNKITRSSEKPRTYETIEENTEINNLKTIVNQIKLENPNYPVYKSFKSIYQKSGKNIEKPLAEKSPKRRSKKGSRRNRSISKSREPNMVYNIPTDTLWTEKYKPASADDIIGNTAAVNSLKKWLELWLSFSGEINLQGKRKRAGSMSDSDFESTDGGSRDSLAKLPKNTLILSGPNGSGKTAAVYAICNELGFNVLELNASSKRTGKRLLQELQEATQSHQVRKKQLNPLNIFQTSKSKEPEDCNESNNKQKMCILLVEDVDIVFEQDDGFLPALCQLVSTSKRPIILTTSDENSFFAQKFINQYDHQSFLPISSQTLAVWLQLVCLVEGTFVRKDDIGLLLEFNRGDVRKTLLELQYWVLSGGQRLVDNDLPLKYEIRDVRSVTPEVQVVTDHEADIKIVENDCKVEQEVYFQHKNCIASFETFTDNLPHELNLTTLWWNIPNILNAKSMAQERLDRFTIKQSNDTVDSDVKPMKNKNSFDDKLRLAAASKFYDSLVLTDILLRNNSHLEPPAFNKRTTVKDSLELTECLESCRGNFDLSVELTRFLVDGHISEYGKLEGSKCRLDMSVPVATERRWRAKQLHCEDNFRQALPPYSCTDLSSISLDYLPFMRQIARAEEHRVANNTKRGNRFRHYFRDFKMDFSQNTCTLSCNILFNS